MDYADRGLRGGLPSFGEVHHANSKQFYRLHYTEGNMGEWAEHHSEAS